jgi:hypothetical protein
MADRTEYEAREQRAREKAGFGPWSECMRKGISSLKRTNPDEPEQSEAEQTEEFKWMWDKGIAWEEAKQCGLATTAEKLRYVNRKLKRQDKARRVARCREKSARR